MAERIPVYVRFAPFKYELVPGEGANDPSYRYQALLPFRDNPRWLVRINRGWEPDSYLSPLDEHIRAREELARLQNLYGVTIPAFHTVVVGPFTVSVQDSEAFLYYTLEEKVDGKNLYEARFSRREVEVAAKKIDRCFAGVAEYLSDTSKKGGDYIVDLTFGGGIYRSEVTKNEEGGLGQYMWGTRPGKTEKEVILTDIGPNVSYYDTNECQSVFYEKVMPGLIGMIVGMERRLGSRRLVQAREVVLNFIDSIPSSNVYYQEMVELKAKLQEES